MSTSTIVMPDFMSGMTMVDVDMFPSKNKTLYMVIMVQVLLIGGKA